MNKFQSDMLKTTLIWWGVKAAILVTIYFWLIYPNLSTDSEALKNFINIAYGFLAIFIIFAMKGLSVRGLFSFKKK